MTNKLLKKNEHPILNHNIWNLSESVYLDCTELTAKKSMISAGIFNRIYGISEGNVLYKNQVITNISTIGIDFKIRNIIRNEKMVRIQIIDTAGHERFRSITQSQYRNAMRIIVMYDVTDKDSLNNIRYWFNNMHDNCVCKIPICLIRNKTDLVDNRKITLEQGQQLTNELNGSFYETSAKNDKFVSNSLNFLVDEIIENIVIKKEQHTINVTNKLYQQKEKKCCN
jgi:small GTP-binding protein